MNTIHAPELRSATERCIAFSKGQMTAKQARAKLLSIARFTPASILNVVGGAA